MNSLPDFFTCASSMYSSAELIHKACDDSVSASIQHSAYIVGKSTQSLCGLPIYRIAGQNFDHLVTCPICLDRMLELEILKIAEGDVA